MVTEIRLAVLGVALTLSGCVATAAHRAAGDSFESKDSTCLTATGSRIPSSGTSCSAVGRSYTGEDIDRTGATSAAAALQLLDPSLTVHR